MTWQKNSWLSQFFEFRPEILHAYFWMHMESNNDEKKYRFFYPFTGEAPLNLGVLSTMCYSFVNIFYFALKFLQYTLNILYFRNISKNRFFEALTRDHILNITNDQKPEFQFVLQLPQESFNISQILLPVFFSSLEVTKRNLKPHCLWDNNRLQFFDE